MMTFEEMGISPELVQAVEELGFENPMPVQEATIPQLLSHNRDIVALAQTGTGKTAAFGLPIIQQMDFSNHDTEALILSPTRELCVQIYNDLKNYSKYTPGCPVVAVYGGASIEQQKIELRKGTKIIVATPGRLLDLIRRKYILLKNIKTVVLDEADEMLDLGFKEDLDEILREIPASKRILLFSATMPKEVEAIAQTYMTDPMDITVGTKNSGAENVSHYYYLTSPKNRYAALKRIVDYYPRIYGIIFCKTKLETQEVASSLIKDGYNADALHGDLSQAQRDHVMHRFRCKNIQILVATDVAARGLDVNNLTHVINYNLPNEASQYNHRSGRTGRANKKGISISILTPREAPKINKIEQLLHKKFELARIPSGKEICEKQLFYMVDEMENVDVNYAEIESYLPVIHKKLAWLDKDELIRRFVSVEFNRFLDYYRHTQDINVNAESSREKSTKSDGRRAEMVRLNFGLGYRDNIVPQRLIGLINDKTGKKKIQIGKIDIYEEESFVDVDAEYAGEIIAAFENTQYKGIDLIVKTSNRKMKRDRPGYEKRSSSKQQPFYRDVAKSGKKKDKKKKRIR